MFGKSFTCKRSEVEVCFARSAPVFESRLSARGLKPNFAYQVKLVVLPPALWGSNAHAVSNRAIG